MDAQTPQSLSARDVASHVLEALRPLAGDLQAACADEGHGPALQGLVRRLERLVEDLQAVAGRQTLIAATLRPLDCLEAFATVVRPLLDARLALRVRVDDACRPCRADPRALNDALLRLVTHARDAMAAGGTIELVARPGRFDDGSDATEIGVGASGRAAPGDALCLVAVEGFALQSGGCLHLPDGPDGASASLLLPCSGPNGPAPRD